MISIKREDNLLIVERQEGLFGIPICKNYEQRFEKLHGKNSLIKLYQLLAEDCRSFSEIGRMFQLSRERIRQIHKKQLAPFLPSKCGHERRRICTIARLKRRPLPPLIREIWSIARRNCVKADVIISGLKDHPRISRRSLILNGNKARVLMCKNKCLSYKGSSVFLTHNSVSLKTLTQYDVIIFIIAVPGFRRKYFLIPASKMLDVSYSRDLYKIEFKMPIEKEGDGINYAKKYNWWQYENAWHILQDKSIAI